MTDGNADTTGGEELKLGRKREDRDRLAPRSEHSYVKEFENFGRDGFSGVLTSGGIRRYVRIPSIA
jgi:hypothetical protein